MCKVGTKEHLNFGEKVRTIHFSDAPEISQMLHLNWTGHICAFRWSGNWPWWKRVAEAKPLLWPNSLSSPFWFRVKPKFTHFTPMMILLPLYNIFLMLIKSVFALEKFSTGLTFNLLSHLHPVDGRHVPFQGCNSYLFIAHFTISTWNFSLWKRWIPGWGWWV